MDHRVRAGRQAALLFGIGGARTLAAIVTSPEGGMPELQLGLADLALALAAYFVPWQRLPAWASLLLTLPAFVAMAVTEALGLVPERASGVSFLIVFAWVGAHHRRWASLALLPAAGLAYSLPMASTEQGVDVRALLLTLAVSVLVAEIIAHARDSAASSQERAERAARAFGVVARASAGLHLLDPDRVLDAVADALIDLGYDGANLAVLDATQNRFRVRHARGLALEFGALTLDASEGITGVVRRTGEPVVVDDYQVAPMALEAIRAKGVRSAIAVPVFRGSDVVAVLYATSLQRRNILDEEVEAMRILAATAGSALENAEEFLAERTSAQEHATAALTDPLTGVGNRRHAQQLLDALRPGDCVVMIDLDYFKDVNDQLGHPAGDKVLCALADYLVSSLRAHDWIARFGGEEFLVVLTDLPAARAELTVRRLLEGWRATRPATTFSAGVAHHDGGTAAATVEHADQALYAAKAGGRNTLRTYASTQVVVPRQGSGVRTA